MYAIIKTGGKQYRVAAGDSLRVEKLEGEIGSSLELDHVLLLVGDGEARIGSPLVEGAKVQATIMAQGRAKKIIVFKKRRRSGFHKKQGHRQAFTQLKITGITA